MNPLFSKNVKSNTGKTLLNLIERYFPKTNKLHKIFNKNTVKVIYSCMSTMSSILSSHNLNVVNPCKTQTYGCNCRIKESCPLQNQFLKPKVVYRTDVENDISTETKLYLKLTETPFKEQFRNHTSDFKYKTYSKRIELSKYIWDLKETGINTIAKWSNGENLLQHKNKLLQSVSSREIVYH